MDIAVAAYNAKTGYTSGGPVPSASATNLVPSYLQSFPSSPNYTISIVGGVVMVATPGGAAVPDSTAGACAGAGGGTTTLSTPASPISNGVTVTPSADNYNNYGGQERLILSNPTAITALTITITVAQPNQGSYTPNNSFPGGVITYSVTGSAVFTFGLASGQSISAGYNGTVYATFGGTGATHATSGDLWTVVSTANNGITSTLSGHF